VEIVTADVNTFAPARTFDRIVSIEMFEHMRNYRRLLARIASWMEPDARLFVHLFCHARFAYPYVVRDASDWMAAHFFTGGIMPSADLLLHFQRDVRLVDRWAVGGRHYERTSNAWLEHMDRRRAAVLPILAGAYGAADAARWWVRWRVFFMACAELFGFRGGREWFVAHYLFERAGTSSAA
jgi:cyclopropane-fatty-acyl-phospholipid synthase